MSYKYLIFITFLSLSAAIPLKYEKKIDKEIHRSDNNLIPFNIIGGKTTDIKKHPYQVAIIINGTFEGSGVILDKNWVATLASLVFHLDSDDIIVSAGNNDYNKGTRYGVQEMTVHPNFEFYTLDNDIALLKLNSNIKFGKSVRKIAIGNSLKDGQSVTLSGWGLTSESETEKASPIFKELSLKIVNKTTCSSVYQDENITSSMICAYQNKAGPCWYDFGDTIADNNKKFVYGLFSWAKGCALDNYPGIYTDLVSLNKWIQSIIKKKDDISVSDRLDLEKTKNYKNVERPLFLTLKNKAVKIQNLFLKNHFLSKRSADLYLNLLNNNNNNIETEIKNAIEEEENEEAHADEEENEQEEEEDEAEEEAVEIIKEEKLLENLDEKSYDNDINEIENQELEYEKETDDGLHIAKRDIDSVKFYGGVYGDDYVTDETIREEEEEEALAAEEKLEQEEEEEIAEAEGQIFEKEVTPELAKLLTAEKEREKEVKEMGDLEEEEEEQTEAEEEDLAKEYGKEEEEDDDDGEENILEDK
ncbi:uncharacterized protein LOC142318900 [Lycorma delicatula]|uniref:uncharacterized protein LOC142318900 n=1 Tax=Lycorma delicatula TaxID=130591 RepID=UPI003F517622